MNGRAFAAIFAAISICIALPDAARAQPVTPEMFGALPNVREVAISPDGKTVAMLQSAGKASAVVFYDLDDPSVKPTGVGVGEGKARGIEWADNDHLLLLISQASNVATNAGLRRLEFWRWASVSRSKNKATILLGNEPGVYLPSPGSFLAVLPGEEGRILLARWTAGSRVVGGSGPSRLSGSGDAGYSLFAVDLSSGSGRIVERGEAETYDWLVDASGNAIARLDYDDVARATKLFVRAPGAKQFTLAATTPEVQGEGLRYSMYGLAETPGVIFATGYGNSDKRSLIEIELATGAPGKVRFQHSEYDIDWVDYAPRAATATGIHYTDDLPRVFHLNPADQRLQGALADAMPGAYPMIVSRSDDGARAVVRAIYSDHPDQFFLFDKASRNLAFLSASYAGLDGKVFAAKQKFDYHAADGLRIHGYLTVPAGAVARNMPLIVLPHGGPEGRDDQSFDWWPFFYAARGYLVYQPNFRGSDGYGYAFKSAGFGQWGRKMQDDITEGVKKLIADGYVDPARICIVGASYGGYAALAGATLTPDVYSCAVSVGGVTNLMGMLGEEARSSEFAEDYWEKRIGDRFADEKAIRAVSPVDNAANAKAPILLIHGRDDTVVPFTQAQRMREALKAAKKQFEFVELKGEDHWLSRAETRTEMLARSIEFIDKHIGDQQRPASQ